MNATPRKKTRSVKNDDLKDGEGGGDGGQAAPRREMAAARNNKTLLGDGFASRKFSLTGFTRYISMSPNDRTCEVNAPARAVFAFVDYCKNPSTLHRANWVETDVRRLNAALGMTNAEYTFKRLTVSPL